MAKIKYVFPTEAYLDNPFLKLVSAKHPLKTEYKFSQFKVGRQSFDLAILDDLLRLLAAADQQMFKITLSDGYESLLNQKKIFQKEVNRYLKKGFTERQARDKISDKIETPGVSEHAIGLAVDLIDTTFLKEKGKPETEVDRLSSQQWLIGNSYKYGFILRYPRDKESITGVLYRPWHFRFVGIEIARFMFKENLCLEELIALLKKNKRNKIFIRTQYNQR